MQIGGHVHSTKKQCFDALTGSGYFESRFQPGVGFDDNVKPAVVSENDVFTDAAIWAYLASFSNGRAVVNDGGGMAAQDVSGLKSINVTLASLTTSPSTRQVPFALPILPRDFSNSTSMVSISPG